MAIHNSISSISPLVQTRLTAQGIEALRALKARRDQESEPEHHGELDLRTGQYVYIPNVSGPDIEGIEWVRLQRREILKVSKHRVRLGAFEEARWPAGEPPDEPLQWHKLDGYYGIACTMSIRKLQEMPVYSSYSLEGGAA